MTQSISASDLSAIVGNIYDAAVEPSLWPQTIAVICETLGFATGVISLISLPDGKAMISQAVWFDPVWLARFPHYEPDLIDLWGGDEVVHGLPLDQPAVLSSLNPQALAEDSTNRFHREFNQPQGFIDAVAIGLSRDDAAVGNIGFNRHRAAGPIGPRELEAFALLIPHLQRAARISRVIDAERVLTHDFARVLDGLSAPTFLVTKDLGLVYANQTGERLLKDNTFVTLTRGKLTFALATAQKTLCRALAGSSDAPDSAGRADVVVQVAAGDRGVSLARVVPMHGVRPDGGTSSDIAGTIFLTGNRMGSEPSPGFAVSVFGLSQAEERVFALVGGGRTVSQTASELGLNVSTVRTHLLRVFEKTGTHRQAELVRLYAGLRVPG